MEAVLIMQFKMRKRRLQLSEKTEVKALIEPQQLIPGPLVAQPKLMINSVLIKQLLLQMGAHVGGVDGHFLINILSKNPVTVLYRHGRAQQHHTLFRVAA